MANKKKKKKKLDGADAAALFALANGVVYAALFQGMALYGGIRFITAACWGVWGLWSIRSNYCKKKVGELIHNPKESLLAVASVLLNSTSIKSTLVSAIGGVDDDGEGSLFEDGDCEEQHIGLGGSCTFPTSMLLTDCDNGFDWGRIKEGEEITIKQLVKRRNDVVSLTFVHDATYVKRMQQFNARKKGADDEKKKDHLYAPEDYHKIVVRRGDSFTFPRKKVLVDCDNGLGKLELSDVTSYAQLNSRSEDVTLFFVSEQLFSEKSQMWADKEAEETAMPPGVAAARNSQRWKARPAPQSKR